MDSFAESTRFFSVCRRALVRVIRRALVRGSRAMNAPKGRVCSAQMFDSLRTDPGISQWFRDVGKTGLDYDANSVMRAAKLNRQKIKDQAPLLQLVLENSNRVLSKVQAKTLIGEKTAAYGKEWGLKVKHRDEYINRTTYKWRNICHHLFTAAHAKPSPRWFTKIFPEHGEVQAGERVLSSDEEAEEAEEEDQEEGEEAEEYQERGEEEVSDVEAAQPPPMKSARRATAPPKAAKKAAAAVENAADKPRYVYDWCDHCQQKIKKETLVEHKATVDQSIPKSTDSATSAAKVAQRRASSKQKASNQEVPSKAAAPAASSKAAAPAASSKAAARASSTLGQFINSPANVACIATIQTRLVRASTPPAFEWLDENTF